MYIFCYVNRVPEKRVLYVKIAKSLSSDFFGKSHLFGKTGKHSGAKIFKPRGSSSEICLSQAFEVGKPAFRFGSLSSTQAQGFHGNSGLYFCCRKGDKRLVHVFYHLYCPGWIGRSLGILLQNVHKSVNPVDMHLCFFYIPHCHGISSQSHNCVYFAADGFFQSGVRHFLHHCFNSVFGFKQRGKLPVNFSNIE